MKFKINSFWFTKKKKLKKAKVNGHGGSKEFFSKLSGSFMLPISIMSIAGLLLGIGSAIETNISDYDMKHIGTFIKNMGEPIFGAMPVLFAAAIVVGFTEEAGVAVFAVIIAMLVFSSMQTGFIDPVDKNGVALHGSYSPDKIKGYKILFTAWGRNPKELFSLVGETMGYKSLNSSIFGGIVVGSIVVYLYKRFHTIKLPMAIAFFGGKRFVPIVSLFAMVPLSFIFLLFWPWIGIGLYVFGNSLGSVPFGFESLIFGYVERALLPFGLHHVFYAPLWWTAAGGDVNTALAKWQAAGNHMTAAETAAFLKAFLGDGKTGDSFIWLAANQLPFNVVTWTDPGGMKHSLPVFDFISKQLHIKVGRFLDGKYPFMIFGLPAAAFAMAMAAPKANRRVAFATVIPAAITSFVAGVTEPIEFTFLFLAPLLFWGFHATMAGISFMLMNVLGVHIGMTFSGGLLDMLIYGVLPFAKGTHFWWAFVVGPFYAVIYYYVFYYWIIKANLQTPGRGKGFRLFTKKDYKLRKQAGKLSGKNAMTQQSKDIIVAFGGWNNITSFSNCATRLRYDVKDIKKVDTPKLKAAGAYGVVHIGTNHVQTIMGPQAAQINANIQMHKGESITDDVHVTSAKAVPAK